MSMLNLDRVRYSIIVPVYNVAAYLEQCVCSVLNQTHSSFEIILVDDGSTDESGVMCDRFVEQDTRIRVVHQRNRGLSGARNTGISLAKGEYILFLDSDDYWHNPFVLQQIEKRIQKTNPEVISFNYIKVTGEAMSAPYFQAATEIPTDISDTLQFQIDHNLWIACAWNKAIRRELFATNDLLFREGVTSEDVDWCIRLAMVANRLDYIPEVIVCYRQRPESISKSVTSAKISILLNNIDYCLQLMKGCSKEELLKSYVAYQYGTVLFYLALLPKSEEKQALIRRAGEYRYLLKWSKNRKIKLLEGAVTLGGLRFALLLLRIKYRK